LGASDQKSIAAVSLKSAPIDPSWIVAGSPQTRSAELSRSRDGSAVTVIWDCTAGDFDWSYTEDETVHILEGEAIVDEGSLRRTLRPGDVYLFPAGSTYRWHVPIYVKKLAFLRVPMPYAAFLAVRVLRKLQALMRSSRARLRRGALGRRAPGDADAVGAQILPSGLAWSAEIERRSGRRSRASQIRLPPRI
jgi:uncharacterized cupin superfamily protein